MGEKTHLFVYGTLRPPLPGSRAIYSTNYPKVQPFLHGSSDAWLEGADLYDLGAFPAAVPGSGRLIGALLEIDEGAFEILDPLEGHPDLYMRRRVQVQTASGPVEAWVYWAPEDLACEGTPVPSGDWLLDRPTGTDSPGL